MQHDSGVALGRSGVFTATSHSGLHRRRDDYLRKGSCEVQRAAEQGDAPDEALELKMPNDDPSVINVRFAGDPPVLRT